MDKEIKDPAQPAVIGEPSVCESCGETFGCGAKLAGCWCVDVQLAEDATETLKAKFEACLCPKCLENYTQDQNGAA